MDNDELGRVGALDSNDVARTFRPEEPLARLWAQPAACVDERALAVERDRSGGTAGS